MSLYSTVGVFCIVVPALQKLGLVNILTMVVSSHLPVKGTWSLHKRGVVADAFLTPYSAIGFPYEEPLARGGTSNRRVRCCSLSIMWQQRVKLFFPPWLSAVTVLPSIPPELNIAAAGRHVSWCNHATCFRASIFFCIVTSTLTFIECSTPLFYLGYFIDLFICSHPPSILPV